MSSRPTARKRVSNSSLRSNRNAGESEKLKSNQKPRPSTRQYYTPLLLFAILTTILTLSYIRFSHSNISNVSQQPSNTNTFKRYPDHIGAYEDEPRRAVIDAIKASWSAYADSEAWGSDDFYVMSGTGGNLTKGGSIGYFIVDVLDTILLTKEMDQEYQRARDYVKNDLRFDIDGNFNAFETTIRVLGGLLSAYHLTGFDKLYLEKAIELGTRLLPIFDSPTGIPYSLINLKTGQTTADPDNSGYSSLAEATTLQLEFKYLAELSQRRVFWDVAERAMMAIKDLKSHNGLLPILISPIDGSSFFHIRLGSRGDSYYEYLIKQYLQTNLTEPIYREMYDIAMNGVKEELVRETPGGLVYTGELHPTGDGQYKFVPKQDHLVCFLGGSLMLGVTEGKRMTEEGKLKDEQEEDWRIGKELIRTCVNTYEMSSTGLAAEIVEFSGDRSKNGREWIIPHYNPDSPPLDARNILRPETVESLFLAWRLTHDPIYREWGWQIFQAFNEHCRMKKSNENSRGGFFSILDVDQVPVRPDNRMETFWLAETLKYLLLLFSDDSVVPLDQYVLNTEAHLFPVFTPTVV